MNYTMNIANMFLILTIFTLKYNMQENVTMSQEKKKDVVGGRGI